MSSEHRNRTNKAQAIAAALVTVGVTAADTTDLPEVAWSLAAEAGWYIANTEGVEGIARRPWDSVSADTRREVRRLLAADEARRAEDAEGLTAHRTDDVFVSIAAGSVLPRPVQDPDRAPAALEVIVSDLVPEGTVVITDDPGVQAIARAGAAPVSTREWLAARNYGALPTESWD